jgi:hypothetical protein
LRLVIQGWSEMTPKAKTFSLVDEVHAFTHSSKRSLEGIGRIVGVRALLEKGAEDLHHHLVYLLRTPCCWNGEESAGLRVVSNDREALLLVGLEPLPVL